MLGSDTAFMMRRARQELRAARSDTSREQIDPYAFDLGVWAVEQTPGTAIETSGGLLSEVVFMEKRDKWLAASGAVLHDPHSHWTTADTTVLNVFGVTFGRVDNDFDHLSAIGTASSDRCVLHSLSFGFPQKSVTDDRRTGGLRATAGHGYSGTNAHLRRIVRLSVYNHLCMTIFVSLSCMTIRSFCWSNDERFA
jgi:hypothetical protein